MRPIVTAAALGAVSGGLSYLGLRYIRMEGSGGGAEIVKWIGALWPGIIFAIIIGVWLWRIGRAKGWQAAAFVPLDAGAWYAAYWFAINGHEDIGLNLKGLWLIGLAAGFVGAVLLSVGALLVFRSFRRAPVVIATIVAGTVAGLLLAVGVKGWELLVLFVGWQAAVAACIGWGAEQAQRR